MKTDFLHLGKGYRSVGADVAISELAVIKRPELFSIGKHCAIDAFCYFTTDVKIGDYVHFAPGTYVIGGASASLVVGHFAEFSPGCRIICASDEWLGEGLVSPMIPEMYRDTLINAPVIFKPFSGLGTGAVVMPGVTLHEGAVLGANSFTKQDIPPWTVWAGNPAKFIRVRRSDKMKQYARELGYDL